MIGPLQLLGVPAVAPADGGATRGGTGGGDFEATLLEAWASVGPTLEPELRPEPQVWLGPAPGVRRLPLAPDDGAPAEDVPSDDPAELALDAPAQPADPLTAAELVHPPRTRRLPRERAPDDLDDLNDLDLADLGVDIAGLEEPPRVLGSASLADEIGVLAAAAYQASGAAPDQAVVALDDGTPPPPPASGTTVPRGVAPTPAPPSVLGSAALDRELEEFARSIRTEEPTVELPEPTPKRPTVEIRQDLARPERSPEATATRPSEGFVPRTTEPQRSSRRNPTRPHLDRTARASRTVSHGKSQRSRDNPTEPAVPRAARPDADAALRDLAPSGRPLPRSWRSREVRTLELEPVDSPRGPSTAPSGTTDPARVTVADLLGDAPEPEPHDDLELPEPELPEADLLDGELPPELPESTYVSRSRTVRVQLDDDLTVEVHAEDADVDVDVEGTRDAVSSVREASQELRQELQNGGWDLRHFDTRERRSSREGSPSALGHSEASSEAQAESPDARRVRRGHHVDRTA